jgi:hypothetical protein
VEPGRTGAGMITLYYVGRGARWRVHREPDAREDSMKWSRMLVTLAVVVVLAPACSSPTDPRLPSPEDTSKNPPPNKPGLTVPG